MEAPDPHARSLPSRQNLGRLAGLLCAVLFLGLARPAGAQFSEPLRDPAPAFRQTTTELTRTLGQPPELPAYFRNTVDTAAPVSLSPNSGSGAAQTFQLQYMDPRGAAALTNAWIYFTPAFNSNSANTCIMYYDPRLTRLYLADDAGTTMTSAALGASTTLQNSQCSVDLASTVESRDGSNLTLSLPVTFAPGFAGARQVWMYANGLSGTSGWVQMGAWTALTGAPILGALSPNTMPAGSPQIILSASGSGFTSGATIRWTPPGSASSINLATSFIGATQLQATVPASLMASPGTAHLAVLTGGVTTASTTFTITPPSPGITAVAALPNSGAGLKQMFEFTVSDSAGASDIRTVWAYFTPAFNTNSANTCLFYYDRAAGRLYMVNDNGAGFQWALFGVNGGIRNNQCSVNLGSSTATLSGNDMTVAIPVTFDASFAGDKQVWLYAAGTTASSGWQQMGAWTVTGAQLNSMNPTNAAPGSGPITLTVNGAGFAAGATVQWAAGSTIALATTFINSTQLQATVPASLLATAGTAGVSVISNGLITGSLLFRIVASPQLTSISPNTAVAGSGSVFITATGTNFIAASNILLFTPEGSTFPAYLNATFVSPTQLQANIPAYLLLNAGTAQVAVLSDWLQTAALTFTITTAGNAQLTSISPSTVPAGSGSLLLTLNGSSFANGASVLWTPAVGTATTLPATFIGPTLLRATIPASLLAAAGTAQVAVVSAGTTTAALPFSITTVAPGVTPIAVIPNSGLGGAPIFQFQYSDPSGASDLAAAWFQFTASPSNGTANSCLFYYEPASNRLYLADNSGLGWSSGIVGTNILLRNSQCSVRLDTTTATLSGNILTLSVPMMFITYFQSTGIWMRAVGSAADSGWQQIGTWGATPIGPPGSLDSISPNTAAAGSGSFLLTANGNFLGAGAFFLWTAPTGEINIVPAGASSTLAQATIPAGLLSTPGVVQVEIGLPNRMTSIALPFTITAPPVTAVSVTPATGSGMAQTFQFHYSDSLGAADLRSAWVYFTPTFNSNSARTCIFYFDRVSNRLNLVDDAAMVWTSGALGAIGTLQNSQCTLNLNSATATTLGNDLTLSVPVTFNAAFAGPKQVWMYAAGGSGNSGWQHFGNWTVITGGPQLTSITPSVAFAGSGSVLLTANGSGFVSGAIVQWTMGTLTALSTTFVNSTQLQATVPANLLSTAGVAQVSVLSGGVLTSSQTFTIAGVPILNSIVPGTVVAGTGPVTLFANGSGFANGASVQWTAGSTTTTLATTFINSTQLQATVPAPLLTTAGIAQVSVSSNGATTTALPFAISSSAATVAPTSVAPNAGSGIGQTFQFQYMDSLGAGDLRKLWVYFTPAFNANSAGTCILYYEPSVGELHLVNDAATAWISGIIGTNGVLQNSQCSLNLTLTSANAAGNTFTLSIPVTFTSNFSGPKQVWMYADGSSLNSGWQRMGDWNVVPGAPPQLSSIAPNTAVAGSGQITITANGSGFVNGASVQWIAGSTTALATTFINSTQLQATVPSSLLATAGSPQVSVVSGGATTAALPFTITANAPPGVNSVSVTPDGGTGTSQIFQFQYSDSLGAADLRTVWAYFTPAFNTNSAGTCLIYYERATNRLYLVNDAATVWSSGVAGTSGTLQNSQCSIGLASVTATPAGNSLTVSVSITFTSAFAGAKQVWMYADGSASSSGWQQRGNWNSN